MLIFNSREKIPHIVLADDDPDECLLFLNSLESLHIHHVFSLAENGAMLLSMLDESEFSPDIIFMSLHAKGISEKDCLLAIRTSKRLDEVPIVVKSTAVDRLEANYYYHTKENLYVVESSFILTLGMLLDKALKDHAKFN